MAQGFNRRVFLAIMGSLAVLWALPAQGWSFLLSQFETRTVEKENFTFDPGTGTVRWNKTRTEPYQLLVDGLVEAPTRFSYKDLRGLPQISQVSDFHCVEGWSVQDVRWGGFRFQEILKGVKTKRGGGYAIFHALGETDSKPEGQKHYVESYPVKKLLDGKEEILLALDLAGEPLTHDRGAPLRLVAPYDLGYKSIKFITRIEFASGSRPGWWTLANPIYPVEAPVPPGRLRKKK